MHVIAREDNCY